MSDYSPAVDCYAENGTEKLSADRQTGEVTASVVLRCAKDDYGVLITDLFDNNRTPPFVTATVKPIALRCSVVFSVTDDPDSDSQCNEYGDALVTVNYGYPDQATSTNNTQIKISEVLQPSSQVLKLDHRQFRWGSATGRPLQPEEAPGKIDTKMQLSRTYHNVTAVIPFTALTKIGKVNSVTQTSPSLGFTFASETLLMLDPKFTRRTTIQGAQSVDYNQNWMVNPNNWNKIYRPETNTFERIYHVTGSVYNIYQTDSFSDLLY